MHLNVHIHVHRYCDCNLLHSGNCDIVHGDSVAVLYACTNCSEVSDIVSCLYYYPTIVSVCGRVQIQLISTVHVHAHTHTHTHTHTHSCTCSYIYVRSIIHTVLTAIYIVYKGRNCVVKSHLYIYSPTCTCMYILT